MLNLAIPSKGRLKDKSEEWFAAAGYPIHQIGGARGYQARIDGLDGVDVRLLSAREIALGLIDGSLHVGVTGEDLLHDLAFDPEASFDVAERLGFGHADVIVAVPQAWLDVETMADLEIAGASFRQTHGRRLRVATKYLGLTRRFFAEQSVGEYRLVESAGATEAAPASGAADVIVDITSTGATLKANGLKILTDGVMLESQASIAVSRDAKWTSAEVATFKKMLSSPNAAGFDIDTFLAES